MLPLSFVFVFIFVFLLVVANSQDVSRPFYYAKEPTGVNVGQCSSFLKETSHPSDRGWSHPLLGNFYRNEVYCDIKCDRKTCCSPDNLEDFHVNFLLKNDKVENRVLKFGDEKASSLLNGGKVVFIIHGFLNDHRRDKDFNLTRDGWVRRGANAILVDWRKNNKQYLRSIANVRVVGALIGQLVEFLRAADRTVCVGFSLGAQICGEAGTWLKKKGQTLATCHGIDPAGPMYEQCSADIKLDPTDCGLVTAIHTSADMGVLSKTGHCDFWVNNGVRQPGCPKELHIDSENPTKSSVACDHMRGMSYYNHQLLNSCRYNGLLSTNCGLKRECVAINGLGMIMSPDDTCTPLDNKDFFVKTNGDKC